MFIANDWQTGLLPVYMAGRPKHQHHQHHQRQPSDLGTRFIGTEPLETTTTPAACTFATSELMTFKTHLRDLRQWDTLRIDASLMLHWCTWDWDAGCWISTFMFMIFTVFSRGHLTSVSFQKLVTRSFTTWDTRGAIPFDLACRVLCGGPSCRHFLRANGDSGDTKWGSKFSHKAIMEMVFDAYHCYHWMENIEYGSILISNIKKKYMEA